MKGIDSYSSNGEEGNNIDRYVFYYDESEHSRKINLNTINANNYYDNFISVIVGWKIEREKSVYEKYSIFEEKYNDRKSKGELKSHILYQSQFKYGLASMNKSNVCFLNDFLSLIDDDVFVYFAVISKIEFIISQVFSGYKNDVFINIDAMKYSIVKAVLMYKPKGILEGIFENTGDLITMLKAFFTERIQHNKQNISLKERETNAFEQILMLLDDVKDLRTIEWDYDIAFEGFKKYLDERTVVDYTLTIDKEGESGNTLNAAERIGIKNTIEIDSKLSIGVRISDMLAGVLSKLLKALHNSLQYKSSEGQLSKIILCEEWFSPTQEQLDLYKKLYFIVCKLNNAWYKSYSGTYSDDLVTLVALFNYMNQFTSSTDIEKKDVNMHGEYFNSYACQCLDEYYENIRNKLPFNPVSPGSIEYFINHRGAKVYFDVKRQPLLKLHQGISKYNVHSIGINREGVPLATIKEHGNMYCYRLPDDLSNWALTVVGLANSGAEFFPTEVIFQRRKGKIYADIL